MFCRQCGKQMTDGIKFCPYCGSAVLQAKSATPMPQSAGGAVLAGQEPIQPASVESASSYAVPRASLSEETELVRSLPLQPQQVASPLPPRRKMVMPPPPLGATGGTATEMKELTKKKRSMVHVMLCLLLVLLVVSAAVVYYIVTSAT